MLFIPPLVPMVVRLLPPWSLASTPTLPSTSLVSFISYASQIKLPSDDVNADSRVQASRQEMIEDLQAMSKVHSSALVSSFVADS